MAEVRGISSASHTCASLHGRWRTLGPSLPIPARYMALEYMHLRLIWHHWGR